MGEKGVDGTIDVVFKDNIAILILNCGENRWNNTFIKKFHEALDKVERNKDVHALVTTGVGKFYSNGVDLDWLKNASDDQKFYFDGTVLPSIWTRLLTFPMLTVAAINGHAFAAGGILAFAHDYRIMRTGKGWLCINEIHLKLRFSNDVIAFLKKKLPGGQVFHECIVLGRRYTAEEALESGLIDVACNDTSLLMSAKDMIKKTLPRGPYDRDSLKNMKEDMAKDVLKTVTNEYKKAKL